MIPLANDFSLTITAPARIHFGLLPGNGLLRRGGMGVMVQAPSTSLEFQKRRRLVIDGIHQELVRGLVETWFDRFSGRLDGIRSVQHVPLGIRLHRSAPRHAGFGTGTQLALAVATAAFCVVDVARPPITQLAIAMNRCKRTAIGSRGFFHGGLLIDHGGPAETDSASQVSRLSFPAAWRIVLIRSRGQRGIHGSLESAAFEDLNRREPVNRARMLRLCSETIEPAVQAADYEKLGDPLFEFNRLTGESFSDFQHGVYNDPRSARIVEAVRQFGITAVGQSSWGPCIFAIARHDESACELVSHLRSSCRAVGGPSQTEITITQADNQGATVVDRAISLAVT